MKAETLSARDMSYAGAEVEVKIVYLEQDEVRAVRGYLGEIDDQDFFVVHRRDGGWIRLNRKFIVKIEGAGVYGVGRQ